MFLKLSLVSSLLLIQSQTDSKTVHSRRKRFVSMWDDWGGESHGKFAVPERIVKFVRPGSPYEDRVKSTGYLGRPSPLLAKFLNWDNTYEELGPTFSTMLGLTQVKEEICVWKVSVLKIVCLAIGFVRALGCGTVISNKKPWTRRIYL